MARGAPTSTRVPAAPPPTIVRCARSAPSTAALRDFTDALSSSTCAESLAAGATCGVACSAARAATTQAGNASFKKPWTASGPLVTAYAPPAAPKPPIASRPGTIDAISSTNLALPEVRGALLVD